MSQRFVFLGPNGSGKSTQAKKIAAHLNISYVSAGDLLRREVAEKTPFGLQYAEDLKDGKLAPVSVTNALLLAEIKSFPVDKGFIIDGFPRTLEQLEFAKEHFQIDYCVYLKLESVEEIIERSVLRGRSDDTPEVIQNRLNIFKTKSKEILDYYESEGKIITVEATGSIEDVYEKTLSGMLEVVDVVET